MLLYSSKIMVLSDPVTYIIIYIMCTVFLHHRAIIIIYVSFFVQKSRWYYEEVDSDENDEERSLIVDGKRSRRINVKFGV